MSGLTVTRIAVSLFVALIALAMPAAVPAEHSRLELISTGPGPGGNGSGRDPLQVSADGRRVLFHSWDALVPEDTDDCTDPDFPDEVVGCPDLYERFGGATSLVGTAANPVGFLGGSPSLERILLETSDALLPEDTNSTNDLYARINGTFALLSPPSGFPGGVINVSRDAERVFFASTSRVLPEDTDNCIDFYELSSGTFKLMTPNTGLIRPFTCADLTKFFTSADGSRFFWKTDANVTPDDPDVIQGNEPTRPAVDIYETFNGQVRLVSTGPADDASGATPGSQSLEPSDTAVSADGTKVVFTTSEKLVPEDTDEDADVYSRSGGETRLLVPPADSDPSPYFSVFGISADGARVIGFSAARLAPEDLDAHWDLYAIVDGSAELLSRGASGGNGAFDVQLPFGDDNIWDAWSDNLPTGMSEDASVITFGTAEQLVIEDTDGGGDLYASVDGVVRLISTGTNDINQSFAADVWRGGMVSSDGSRIFFADDAPYAREDDDSQVDVYEWQNGRTTVVPDGVPTPEPVNLADFERKSMTPDGSRLFIGTSASLTLEDAGDTAEAYDIYGVAVNNPPVCETVKAKPPRMWPVTNRLHAVVLSGATDPDGDPVSIGITGVTQDEPVGQQADAVLKPGRRSAVRIRAERHPARDGRVYRIAFDAVDDSGGSCEGMATVSVRRKRHIPARDSFPHSWNSIR